MIKFKQKSGTQGLKTVSYRFLENKEHGIEQTRPCKQVKQLWFIRGHYMVLY